MVGAHCFIRMRPTSVEPVKLRWRGQRRLLGRLDDDGAAGGQGRGDLARDHRDGEVPRRDGGADADGLLQDDEALVVVGRGDGLAVDALGFLGEPLDEARAVDHFPARFGQRLALLGGHDPGEVVGVLDQQGVPLHQDRAALLGGLAAPGGPGGVRGGDGGFRLGGAQQRDIDQLLARGRVGHIEAVAAGDPLAIEQGIGLEQRRVGEQGEG
jgi:hypothetical protein